MVWLSLVWLTGDGSAQYDIANWRWHGSVWYGSLEMAWLSVVWLTGDGPAQRGMAHWRWRGSVWHGPLGWHGELESCEAQWSCHVAYFFIF